MLTPAAIGGIAGFVANQLAEIYKERRKEDAELRAEELKEARGILRDLVDEQTKAPIRTAEAARVHIDALSRKRRRFQTDDARAKMTAEIGELENLRDAFQATETAESERKKLEEESLAAKKRGDDEAARKAQLLAQESAAKAAKEAERSQVLERLNEERLRRAHVF